MGKQVTIYDVARESGVSISTVSNALNRPERVSSATRGRVLEAADRLGFVPKPAAVSQARAGAGCIGILAPFSSYASYYARLTGALRALRDTGLETRVVDIESAAAATSPVLAASAIRGHLDGLIVMGERIEDAVERRLAERGMPTVLVDAASERFSVIVSDDFRGGALAARHLLELGHRSIGYLIEQQESDYESQARQRLDGFRHALEQAGGATLVVRPTGSSAEEARAAARDVLAGPDRPTAVMAHFDELAVGALRAAAELSLSVPGDVSVMGYDDGPAADAVGLTTVRQPFEQSGAAAVGVLAARMADPAAPRTVTVLDCALVPRLTTGTPR
ncbi:LacI family transcriptional regulator [Motilibacter rhizosphaerae]|uniref:LacI family transcriptional regulator n=1 Tax=Motilibacter rhizosphaerae TaxID=598652 RepID=A0A4Q7NXL3_9ACTN|nr:LacI family DNA-binding transcriptional regulator [Motilibacter rhizosphaerae]RZS91648.1 LacI family transcriptional regulator [Motilibacter rhizosphaerae]